MVLNNIERMSVVSITSILIIIVIMIRIRQSDDKARKIITY